MSPSLALLIGFGFVLFMLVREGRRAPKVSAVTWLATIWMLYVSVKPLDVWLDPWLQSGDGNVESGSVVDRVFLSVLLCVSLMVLCARGFDWTSAIRNNRWLIVLVAFMLLSVYWSAIPYISFKRWIRQFQAILVGFLILSELSPREALETVLRRVVFILIPLSVVMIKYFPDYGVAYNRWDGALMWIGVTTQKNGLGRLCLVSGFVLIWGALCRWEQGKLRLWERETCLELLMLLMILVLLRGPSRAAASATSASTLALGTLALGWLYWSKTRAGVLNSKMLMAIIPLIIILGTLTPLVGGVTVGSLAGAVGRDSTLTGRTDIWAWVVPIMTRHELIGVGFGGFWTPATIEVFNVNECHNGYLEVLVETGVAGLVLHAVFLLTLCRRAVRALAVDFQSGALCFCLILMSAVYNISESSMNVFAGQLSATLIFAGLTLRPGRATKVREFAPRDTQHRAGELIEKHKAPSDIRVGSQSKLSASGSD